MPFVNIPSNTWTSIVTTTQSTIVQNRGTSALYLLTGSTSDINLDAGLEVPPGSAVEFTTGVSVSGASVNKAGGALAHTESTTVFASKPISLIYIGDGGRVEDPCWNANLKLILGRYSTDSDATASSMT